MEQIQHMVKTKHFKKPEGLAVGVSTIVVYSSEQVSDILGVSVKTVHTLIHDGKLGAIRIGRIVRIPHTTLEKFINEQLEVTKAVEETPIAPSPRVKPTRKPKK